MLITTILLTLVMIMIWRTPPVLVALYFFVFFVMEGVYVSAVFTKFLEGGWIPFAISLILAFIMFGWFYGRQRKMEYELNHKISLDTLELLLSNSTVQRIPGFCFFYTNIQDGLTPVLGHYIKNMKSLHKVTMFTTLSHLLVPKVALHERIVVNKLGLKGVYRCVIQYGYADSHNLGGDDLVIQVIDCLRAHIQKESTGGLSLVSPEIEEEILELEEARQSGVVHIRGQEESTGGLSLVSPEIEEEILDLEEARQSGVVHIRGKARFHIGKNCSWFDRIMLPFYEVLHSNCRSAQPALGIPLLQRIEVGMLYEA